MNRTEKVAAIEEMNQAFTEAPHVLLTTFRGLTVNQATELRQKVRTAGGRFQVIKNRLAKRAAAGTPAEGLSGRFSGPCALAIHPDDPVVLAKTLTDFAKANPQIEMLAGVVDAQDLIDEQGIKQLASLPGLPELRAQLLSLIQTPATTLVRLLGTPATQVTRVIDAHREGMGEGS